MRKGLIISNLLFGLLFLFSAIYGGIQISYANEARSEADKWLYHALKQEKEANKQVELAQQAEVSALEELKKGEELLINLHEQLKNCQQ